MDEPKPRGPAGFRGVRNEDTSAARRASIESRQRAALERKVTAAVALLRAEGWTLMPPDNIR